MGQHGPRHHDAAGGIRADLPPSAPAAARRCPLLCVRLVERVLEPHPRHGRTDPGNQGAGYGIYLLSNATSTLHQFFDRIPGSECFDGKLVSADVRLLKPQHEIFELLFETFSLRPEECFFIDDNAANIDGAFAVGMPGAVFFRDFARLRRELRAAGVSVKEQT